MNDLKNYLLDKKLYIEIIGILATITALFLIIPNEDTRASYFMGISQFSLLTIFSIFLFSGLISLHLKMVFIQRKNMENKTISFFEYFLFYLTYSIITLFSCALIFGLWGYLYNTYESYFLFLFSFSVSFFAVFATMIWIFIIDNLFFKIFLDKNPFGGKYPKIGYIIISWFFFFEIFEFYINNNPINKLRIWMFICLSVIIIFSNFIFFLLRSKKSL